MTDSGSKALPTLTILFFMWGFITCLNDILIPYLKDIFTLTTFKSTLVQFAFFGAYFIGALIYFIYSSRHGDPINKYGYKKGIVLGLLLSAIACAMFTLASIVQMYVVFLLSLFVLGFGFTALQIAANPLVTLLGDPKSASGRLNLTQAFNSFGTTIAPIIGGFLIFEYFSTDGEMTVENVRVPYLILAAIFVIVVFVIRMSAIPSLTIKEDFEKSSPWPEFLNMMKFKQLKWGVGGIFCYVGAEVAIGSLMIDYLRMDEIAGMDKTLASKYLAFYWGGAMIGRFLGALNMSSLSPVKKLSFTAIVAFGSYLVVFTLTGLTFEETWPYLIYVLMNYIMSFVIGNKPERILAIFSALNVVMIIMALFGIGGVMWPLLAIGLFNSIMWSNIFSLAIKGLGDRTSKGSSLLVMAILGGALVPPLQGLIVDNIGFAISFLVPAACYVYLMTYGLIYKKLAVDVIDSESTTSTVSH
jgi:FHS family L-fucose permease-like MFS transporter